MTRPVQEVLPFLLFLFIFTVTGQPLFAADSEITAGVSLGLILDIAPFGIENKYVSIGASVTALSGWVSVSPSVSLSPSSWMVRMPVLLNLPLVTPKEGTAAWEVGIFAGGGVEYYKDSERRLWSPVLTGGVRIVTGSFSVAVPAAMAFRGYNNDSDIGVVLGLNF